MRKRVPQPRGWLLLAALLAATGCPADTTTGADAGPEAAADPDVTLPQLYAKRWAPLGVAAGMVAVATDGTVYAGGDDGLRKSADGLRFTRVLAGMVQLIALDPATPGHVMVGLGLGADAWLTANQVRHSRDAGATWSNAGLADGTPIWALAFDPATAGRVYALTGEPDAGLYRSDDGGDSFQKVSATAGAPLAIAADGSVYFGSQEGLAHSHDGGATSDVAPWPAPAFDLRFLLAHPSDPLRLMAGGQDGLYASADAGTTWQRIDPTVGTSPCFVIYQRAAAVPGQPGRVIVSVNAVGPYLTPDWGATWQPVLDGLVGDCITPFRIAATAVPHERYYLTWDGQVWGWFSVVPPLP